MNLLQIKDLKNGKVQVLWQHGNKTPEICPPVPFENPLTPEDQSELSWYLEEYLGFPFGAEEYRAQKVEKKMKKWGESIFEQIFIKGEQDDAPRSYYDEALRDGLEKCECCIRSDDPQFLSVPWELIRDPSLGGTYLAQSLGGFYRRCSSLKVEEFPGPSPNEPFRILLVIARPYGKEDVLLGTVARPMLDAIRPFRPNIQLDILRPPTFDELQKRLNTTGGYYHLVHFDGHGAFFENRGHLVFEKEDGKEDIIDSDELAQVLAACKIPLFVLNACQSAQGGIDPYLSVVSRLAAMGIKGVIAMTYSVYTDTARLFMERFYEKLAGHSSLSTAVAEGRRRIYARPERISVIGPIKLRDWIVPTLYQQETRLVPIPEGTGTAAGEKVEEVISYKMAEEVCPEGRFGFIGRDYEIHRIEHALYNDNTPWVLLTGIGGAGKTELARGFARWYAETGGCPGGVFAASFKEKADFGQVKGSIAGHGTDFSSLTEEEQWKQLVGYLRENKALLIWDNFEPVAGYPHGSEPLAAEEERKKLSRFLKALRGGKSRVLITTRKPGEDWLGLGYTRIEIGGLTERDAGQMARAVLKTAGRKPEDFRDNPDYVRLIGLLRGHPRSLEIVLPQLRRKTPAEIIDAIQHRVDSLGETLEDASLAYVFSHLTPRARKHLPFIGLFSSYVHADTLGIFVGSSDEEKKTISGKVYEDIIGETLDGGGWEAVLEEACDCGLIRPLGSSTYELHPTLPAFLRRQLVSAAGEEKLKMLDAEFMKSYSAWAAAYTEDIRKASENAVRAVHIEEANLLRALRLAVMKEQWGLAQAVVQALSEFYEITARIEEWRDLRSRILGITGREMSPKADKELGSLWMFLLGDEANDFLGRNELSRAESAYLRIVEYLVSLGNPEQEPNIAVGYHQLGRVAGERQDFNKAQEWYKKALEIRERLGLERDAADTYHNLGVVAQERQDFNKAEEWYKKALEIYERLGLERDAAGAYHNLGIVAQERQDFNKAEEWYKKALEIYERLGLERDAAGAYHNLGVVAQERQDFNKAEEWYKKALEIRERLGLERYAASSYHQLGRVAQERQNFDRAEEWYKKALEIYERLGLERDAAGAYHQLGIIAEERQNFGRAEEWYKKALEIKERLGLERDAASSYHQLGIIAEERQDFNKAEEWYKKALEIKERLHLEREAASDYHQLGIVAQERQDFNKAEEWYKKALEIRERLGHPPLKVNIMAQIGSLRREQERLREAVSCFGRALFIAAEYKMLIGGQILVNLAQILKTMGEEEFKSAWRESFEEDPPLELLYNILEQIEGGK